MKPVFFFPVIEFVYKMLNISFRVFVYLNMKIVKLHRGLSRILVRCQVQDLPHNSEIIISIIPQGNLYSPIQVLKVKKSYNFSCSLFGLPLYKDPHG